MGMAAKQPRFVQDINVQNPNDLPTDSVSCVRFSNDMNSNLFATSDWSGKVRIYDIVMNGNSGQLTQKAMFDCKIPILEIYWQLNNTCIFACCIDGKVNAINIQTSQIQPILEDPQIITFIYTNQNNMDIILTFSINKTLKIWKVGNNQPLSTIQLDYVPIKASIGNNGLILATFGNFQFSLFTMQNLNNSMKLNYSKCDLGTPINSAAVSPKSNTFSIGTVDGRILIGEAFSRGNYFDHKVLIQFKAHRSGDSKEAKNMPNNQKPPKELFPVNTIKFHPSSDYVMASGGNNGVIYFWNTSSRGKNQDYDHANIPVTDCDFSKNGRVFVYALGYDWAYGLSGTQMVNYRPTISAYVIQENDLRRRS